MYLKTNNIGGYVDMQARFVGCLVRTAGHDFMDFRHEADGTTTGGTDGCFNLEDPDNAGL